MLFAQENPCLFHGRYESLPRFGSFLCSHSAFSRLQNGFNSLASLWTAWNLGEEIFSGSNDMGNVQGGAFANNPNRPIPPSQFRHYAPQRLLKAGV